MIRTLVVADSGAAMASITAALSGVVGVDIVAYASGMAPLYKVVRATQPDVVLVGRMRLPGLDERRVAEAHAAGVRAVVMPRQSDPTALTAALAAETVEPDGSRTTYVIPERSAA